MVLTEAGPAGPPRFTIGGVIATSFGVLFRNFLQFLVVTVVIVAPAGGLLMLDGFVYASQGHDFTAFGFGMWFTDLPTIALIVVGAAVFLIGYSLVLAAVTHGAHQALRGEPVGIGACLAQGFRLLPRVFAAVLIFLLVLGVILGMAVWAVFFWVWDWNEFAPDASGVALGIGIGVIALVFIALVAVLCWVFVPAVMAERAGPIQCFRRSFALTKGRRWAILAIMILTTLFNWLLSFIAQAIQGAGAAIVGEWLDLASNAFVIVLGAVLAAVGYARLRGEKEGVVVEDVVKVFE
jgi:hypothetical protein